MALPRVLSLIAALLGSGVLLGSAVYAVLHDDPTALCVAIALAFPTAMLFAVAMTPKEK